MEDRGGWEGWIKATRSDWGGGVGLGPVSDTAEELDRWELAGREDERTRPIGVR